MEQAVKVYSQPTDSRIVFDENNACGLLFDAAAVGDAALVRIILAQGRGRLDLNARDRIGYAPLHQAARRGFVEVSRLLLNAGSDVNAVTRVGRTPAPDNQSKVVSTDTKKAQGPAKGKVQEQAKPQMQAKGQMQTQPQMQAKVQAPTKQQMQAKVQAPTKPQKQAKSQVQTQPQKQAKAQAPTQPKMTGKAQVQTPPPVVQLKTLGQVKMFARRMAGKQTTTTAMTMTPGTNEFSAQIDPKYYMKVHLKLAGDE